MTFAATSLLVVTPTSWVASSYEFADYVYVCDGHGVSRILSPPLLLPLHCSHFCFRRTRFLVAHIGRALLLAFSPTVSSCDSSEGARLFCFSQYCQRSFLNRRDRGVRQHAHNGAGFVQPQQMPTLWRPSGSVPAWSIVSERALVLEHVSLLMGRLRGPIEGGGLSACRALRLRSERSSAACCWKEWWNPILRNGTLVRICIIEVSRPCIRHSHCTLEFGRSKSVLHIRWTVIQQRGSHWVRGKNKEVAFGNQWNRFSSLEKSLLALDQHRRSCAASWTRKKRRIDRDTVRNLPGSQHGGVERWRCSSCAGNPHLGEALERHHCKPRGDSNIIAPSHPMR